MVVRLHDCSLDLILTSKPWLGVHMLKTWLGNILIHPKDLTKRCVVETLISYAWRPMLVGIHWESSSFEWNPSPFGEGSCLTSCPSYPYIFLDLPRSCLLFIWWGLLVIGYWIHACTNTLILWALACFWSIKVLNHL